ncbi:hypothetical protein PSFL111601_28095 [Pseudomonas floridensis]
MSKIFNWWRMRQAPNQIFSEEIFRKDMSLTMPPTKLSFFSWTMLLPVNLYHLKYIRRLQSCLSYEKLL